jgi:hypothetical protein
MWCLSWVKWHWDRFRFEFFGLPQSVLYHSTVDLRAHISSGRRTVSPLMAAVQRHCLTPTTERRGRVVNTLASYSENAEFKSRPGDRLSCLWFLWSPYAGGLLNYLDTRGSTQPPIQLVPGALSPGVKRGWGVTPTTQPRLVPRSRMTRSCSPLPTSAFMACSGTILLSTDQHCGYETRKKK